MKEEPTKWLTLSAAVARINNLLKKNGDLFRLRKFRRKGQGGGREFRLFDLTRGELRGGVITNLTHYGHRIGALRGSEAVEGHEPTPGIIDLGSHRLRVKAAEHDTLNDLLSSRREAA